MMATATAAMTKKDMRQPSCKPIMRPTGKPKITASEEPATSILIAIALNFGATSLTAAGVAIDQYIAWAQASTSRAPSKVKKSFAKEARLLDKINTPSVDKINARSPYLEAQTISGIESTITTQAYMDTIRPISASVMAKSSAIADSSPMGINSDVLNKNAAQVIPASGSHSRMDKPAS